MDYNVFACRVRRGQRDKTCDLLSGANTYNCNWIMGVYNKFYIDPTRKLRLFHCVSVLDTISIG